QTVCLLQAEAVQRMNQARMDVQFVRGQAHADDPALDIAQLGGDLARRGAADDRAGQALLQGRAEHVEVIAGRAEDNDQVGVGLLQALRQLGGRLARVRRGGMGLPDAQTRVVLHASLLVPTALSRWIYRRRSPSERMVYSCGAHWQAPDQRQSDAPA